eukprot:CAMPEP_0172440542 /NCGR_PEP_ID=MMETSP1065-20121228/1179_1 /TAXON_ID=265537 /ORGANISM="Amphiprora paludosa, Strain CCMP125" /LENGTH=331 /DNA_ID=CAMNT_0013189441 /DNA_START=80 /DNA_END=1075 /DNA_ORIENTATION=-
MVHVNMERTSSKRSLLMTNHDMQPQQQHRTVSPPSSSPQQSPAVNRRRFLAAAAALHQQQPHYATHAAAKMPRLVQVPTDVGSSTSSTISSTTKPQHATDTAASLLQTAMARRDGREFLSHQQHPHCVLLQIFQKRGCRTDSHGYLELQTSGQFFYQYTPADVAAYTADILRWVRDNNVTQLRAHYQAGGNVKCANTFGESLLHLACRKQLTQVVQFLVQEARVPVAVVDDFGRTPLHDACWTATPNFAVVDLLLAECPDLLLVMDKRGHTPLFYARQEHWPLWMQHLDQKGAAILPRILHCEEEEEEDSDDEEDDDSEDETDDESDESLA